MKKILFFLLIMFTFGLSGCSERTDVGNVSEIGNQEKEELILAGVDFNDNIVLAVQNFNQVSEDTVIILKDYGNQSGVLSNDILLSIYNDVMNGNIADMYIMSPSSLWPIDILIEQDRFVDLYPFLDNDLDISKNDFFPTILETVERDDKLFYFPISYTLQGILGMPEYCDGSRFPVDQISELCHLYPENDILFGTLSSMDLINMELSQNWELYVNWVTRECNFNSKRFREVLEGAYNLPEYRPSSREEVIDYATGAYLLGGKQIFMPYTVSDFEGYLMMTEGMNGSKVKLNPYGGNMVSLTLTDSEVVLDIRSSFAITNVCKNPDTAWEFLQTFLGLEYQKSLLTATAPALPINTLAFVAERNKLLAEGKGKKEDFDYIQGMIESAKTVVSSDLQIESIVYEEVSDYFANQKTAEDAAKIIQDRVSAYLKKY